MITEAVESVPLVISGETSSEKLAASVMSKHITSSHMTNTEYYNIDRILLAL